MAKLGTWEDYPDLRECHAFACYVLGRTDEAEAAFRTLLDEDAYNVFARLGMIKILAAHNDWQQVGEQTKRLHETTPTDSSARLLEQLEAQGLLI